MELEFDYENDYKRLYDDDNGKSEHDPEHKQEKLDGTSLTTSLDDISTETEQPSTTMTFLNEKENWHWLSKNTDPIVQPKKRRKHITPCPDIQIIRQRPKFCLSLPVLVNGNC